MRERFKTFTTTELSQRFERIGLPYAPITRPEDLFDDPHLLATGGLAPLSVPADASGAGHAVHTRAPLLPLTLDGQRLPVRQGPPALGQHSAALLRELGYSTRDIDSLRADGVVAG